MQLILKQSNLIFLKLEITALLERIMVMLTDASFLLS